MRKHFDNLSIDEVGRICQKDEQKLLFRESKANLFLAKNTSYDVFIVESKSGILFDDDGQMDLAHLLYKALKMAIQDLKLKRKDVVLVVGIGNEGLTADSLGARTLDYLKVNIDKNGYSNLGNLCVLSPSVSGVTGIESVDIIKSVVAFLQPKIVICVDTLATVNPQKLAKVIELKTSGITPGAGVGNAKESINSQSIGAPVLSIGVPLVIYARNILLNYLGKVEGETPDYTLLNQLIGDMVVTAKEVDLYVNCYAKVIANAINDMVHGKNR